MKIAIYPGSFDPVTSGHLNIIRRAANIFDKLIVCVMVNAGKHPMFSQEERVEMIRRVTADLPNVEVDSSNELLAEYAKRKELLLKTFGSIAAISAASLQELQRILPKDAAMAVYNHFHQEGEE